MRKVQHMDQLNRDIKISRKRIPWVKYFFQFLLPTFLVSMRAGAQTGKVSVKGDTVALVMQSKNSAKSYSSLEDSLKKIDKKKPLQKIDKKTFKQIRTRNIQFPNKLAVKKNLPENFPEIKFLPVIKDECFTQSLSGTLGGVVVVGVRIKQATKTARLLKDTLIMAKNAINTAFKKISVYPNPVQRNSSVKLDLKKINEGEYTISIVSMSGEVVQTKEVSLENKKQLTELALKNIAAGTYFIHVFNRKIAASYSEKIIVQ